jgi:putative ABC transport system substrate-binding protein
MRRREFITVFGGAAAGWPLTARAQQPAKRIVFLTGTAGSDPQTRGWTVEFERGLEALGWSQGRNITIEYRWGEGDVARVRANAEDVAKQAPDAVLALGTVAVTAMKKATTSIPIVFAVVNDPVTQGIVPDMARPGGNITGFSLMDYSVLGKSMELLTELAPGITRAAVLFNPDNYPFYETYVKSIQASPPASLEVTALRLRSSAEIEPALVKLSGSGLVIAPDTFANINRELLIRATAQSRIPATYPYRQFVIDGGLMTYAPNPADIVKRSATYIDRVLKGAKPSDLPVQAPTKFEFLLNAKTAKALGLQIPSRLLFTADEVIE